MFGTTIEGAPEGSKPKGASVQRTRSLQRGQTDQELERIASQEIRQVKGVIDTPKAMERALMKAAHKKGYKGKRAKKFVYSIMNKRGKLHN